MVIEGVLEFDRLDDDGDVYAVKVWPDDYSGNSPAVVVELMSILGEAWWAEHSDDTGLLSGFGGKDKAKVGEHHPEWLRALVGKRIRVVIEESP